MQDKIYTRRDFLKISAAVGLGQFAIGGPAFGQTDRFQVGCIGVGNRGTVLLNELLALGNVDITAICDITPDNLDKAVAAVEKAQGRKPDTYAKNDRDYRNLLARTDIDAVVIATPCYWHGAMYIDAYGAGKHFYGEKPMCISIKEGKSILQAEHRNPKLVAQIGCQRRADPRYVESIKLLQAGEVGPLVEGRAAWDNAWGPLRGWFAQRKYSGDWMLEQAIHTWDVYNWLLGSRPVRAFGKGRKDIFVEPGRDVTDYYTSTIEWDNSFTLMFHHSWICPNTDAFKGTYERVAGPKGGCELNLGKFTYKMKDDPKVPPTVKDVGTTVNNTRDLLANFFNCIKTGEKPISGVRTAYDAVLAGLLVRAAVDKGGIVTMEELLEAG